MGNIYVTLLSPVEEEAYSRVGEQFLSQIRLGGFWVHTGHVSCANLQY